MLGRLPDAHESSESSESSEDHLLRYAEPHDVRSFALHRAATLCHAAGPTQGENGPSGASGGHYAAPIMKKDCGDLSETGLPRPNAIVPGSRSLPIISAHSCHTQPSASLVLSLWTEHALATSTSMAPHASLFFAAHHTGSM